MYSTNNSIKNSKMQKMPIILIPWIYNNLMLLKVQVCKHQPQWHRLVLNYTNLMLLQIKFTMVFKCKIFIFNNSNSNNHRCFKIKEVIQLPIFINLNLHLIWENNRNLHNLFRVIRMELCFEQKEKNKIDMGNNLEEKVNE